MPTYEYACTRCGQHVEVFQRLSEDPLTTCGVCGGPLRKVFHPAGLVFKGSGFYATDSRRKPGASSGDGEGSGAGDKGGGKDATKDASKGTSEASASSSSKNGSGATSSTGGEKSS